MKVQSVNDAPGQIISISNPGDVGHAASGIGAAGIVPQPGQTCERGGAFRGVGEPVAAGPAPGIPGRDPRRAGRGWCTPNKSKGLFPLE